MPYDPYGADEHRDSRYMDDDEYRRVREAEDDEYEYHGDAADDEAGKETVIHVDDSYPDPIDHTEDEEKKPDIVYEKQGKGGVMRISSTSNLRWLPLFFALPEELVAKRPAYLEIPRHMKLLMKDQKCVNMVLDGSFLETVMDLYSWSVWQYIQVPDKKGGYKDIPGGWHNYSADFPMWRMTYMITSYFHTIFDRELHWNLQYLFSMPDNETFPWLTYQQFSNLVDNATDMAVAELKLQPTIDEVWKRRQPEDYEPFSFKKYEFLRTWNHTRNHPHYSIEGMKEYGVELNDPQAEFDRKVLAEQQVAQFESTLTDTDKLILQYRMKNYKLQDIADIVGYQTAGAVSKRIDRIAEQYERFINPQPDGE
jgi:hypothetical protein